MSARARSARPPAPVVTDEDLPAGSADRARPRIRVIWNPGAGSKGGLPVSGADEPRIRELMAAAGLGDELVQAATPAEIRSEAGDAVSRGYQLVVAAGGDGTVGTVASALLGSETALGILPLGSVMNIARSVGLPRDPAAAAEVIRTGALARIDVGEARGRPFFEAGSVGMNAAMFREAQRFERGDWTSILRTIGVAFRYRPARMAIDLDDRRIRTRALMVTVSNGPYAGAGMTVAPNARLDDGRFDVRVFRRFSKLRLLRHLASIAFGRERYAPEVDTYRSAFVRIESARPLPARADSRDLGATPIEFATRPAALRVVVPEAPSTAG
ncbi:MAG TPA: diacylglycerol kinase family protein [Candidatus Limnocylindrales bacterium]|nr:diacylglycerol kinase family protein [Candidatus Limnocylindrales bacterium]